LFGEVRPCGTREAGGDVRGCEGAKGGAKLLERADMSGVPSNFVKKFVWVLKVVLGLQ
jgi:hypothetical protein